MPIDEKLIKQLLTDYKKPEDIIGENGLLEETTKAILERALQAAKQNGTKRTRAAFRTPWQNGIAERWVGSVRRDLLDHVIVLNQRHLRRLLKEYVGHHHEDRTHLGLGKDTPDGRAAASVSPRANKIISLPRLGGLHHRYAVAA